MSAAIIATAMALASAPLQPGDIAPVTIDLRDTATASDQQSQPVATPPADAPKSEPPASAAPTEAAAQEPEPATEEPEITVMAARRPVPGDPLAVENAKSFAITSSVDEAVAQPVALAYKHSIPEPVRDGLRNFFANLHEPIVFLNFLVQLKPGKAGETLGRFVINSTIGGAGLFDVAKTRSFKLPRRRNGFADSLGYYGVKPGPFLYVPLIGPTTVRDLVGGGVDRLVMPLSASKLFAQPGYVVASGVVRKIDHRAEADERIHKLRDDTTDPYAASRAAYLERRQAEIDQLHGKHRDTADASIDPPVVSASRTAAPAVALPPA